MKISLAGIKAKVVGKCVERDDIGMAAMLPMNAMKEPAGGAETECICEKKCTEDEVNKDCEICSYDYTYCDGEEKKEEEHWGPLTPDGNMNLVDDYGSIEAGGKQFITVTTKAGNFFYIIIDRDDQGDETVHFLNLVDEADLLALMDDEVVEKYMESTGMVAPAEEETPAPVVEEKEPETEEPEVVEEPEKKPTNVNGIMAIVLVIAIGGIGGFLYFKSAKGKKSKPAGPDPDEDYSEDMDFFDDDDEDYGIDDEDIADEPADDSDSTDEEDDE